MTKIVVQPNASGTGTFTIAAPNSSNTQTLTLPDVTGTVLTTAGGTLTGALTGTDLTLSGGKCYLGGTGLHNFVFNTNRHRPDRINYSDKHCQQGFSFCKFGG
jgi:hypothetical protein